MNLHIWLNSEYEGKVKQKKEQEKRAQGEANICSILSEDKGKIEAEPMREAELEGGQSFEHENMTF